MKKILAILLTVAMALGMFALAASAIEVPPADIDAQNAARLQQLFPNNNVRIHMGFAKHNADYFSQHVAANPGMTFSVEPNSLFTINRTTGRLTFNTGPSSLLRGRQTVTVHLGGASRTVNVLAYYEWYEYFVILFAAGIFWIAAVNNG